MSRKLWLNLKVADENTKDVVEQLRDLARASVKAEIVGDCGEKEIYEMGALVAASKEDF